MPALTFTPFRAENFPEYQSWYEDEELSRRLGSDIDDAWLQHVLNDPNGREYCVFRDGVLIAVLGIALPDPENPEYVITDIAVMPELRGQGIGSQVIDALIALDELERGRDWIAYVCEDHPRCKAFLERKGWQCVEQPSEEDSMFKMLYRVPAPASV